MYCLRWWIALFLLPFPSAPPAFLILFLISYTYVTRPCVYCSGILIALFTSSCYWYSGSPTSEEYYGLDQASVSSSATHPTAVVGNGPVEQARSHLAKLQASRVVESSISSDSSVKVGTAEPADNVGVEAETAQQNQNPILFKSDSPSQSNQGGMRPNWCWLDLRGTGTGTGWWEPLKRPGCEARRIAAAAKTSPNSLKDQESKDRSLEGRGIKSKLWSFFFTPTIRFLSLPPWFENLYQSLPSLPPKVFVGIPNSGIGIYLNLSSGL